MRRREFLEFVWEGQDGWFEVAKTPRARGKRYGTFLEMADAVERYADFNYFGPLARKRKGSKAADVVACGNVVWADIDLREAPDLVVECLVPLGLPPSVILDSGNKGFWIYYKLDSMISTSKIEQLNRSLEYFLKSRCDGWNGSGWDRSKIARMPGSYRQETGKRAEIYTSTGRCIDPAAFDALPVVDERRSNSLETSQTLQARSYYTGVSFPAVTLPLPLEEYIKARPAKGEGWDRSSFEQKIFTVLVEKGFSDDQIISFAFARSLPKHLEEWNRQQGGWISRSIQRARTYVELQHREAAQQSPSRHRWHDPGEVLEKLQRPMTTKQLVEACGGQSVRRSVERHLCRLREGGYVKSVQSETDRRKKINSLTTKGRQALEPSRSGHRILCLPGVKSGTRQQHYPIRVGRETREPEEANAQDPL